MRADSYHMTGGTGSLRYMAPEVGMYAAWFARAVCSFNFRVTEIVWHPRLLGERTVVS